MKNRTAISRQLALLIVPLIATLTIYGQSVNSFDCPIITKRNNGNGSASSGPGTFINESGQPSNPVAPNVTATSYKNVPYTFSQKTGNITFEWVTPTPSLSMGLPIINRVWLTASGVTTLMTVNSAPRLQLIYQVGSITPSIIFIIRIYPLRVPLLLSLWIR